jgi:hypothetical protein
VEEFLVRSGDQRAHSNNEITAPTWKLGLIGESDRCGWNERTFEIFGLRVHVCASNLSLLRALLSRASPTTECAANGAGDRIYSVRIALGRPENGKRSPQYLLYVNQELLTSTEELDEVLECFESDLDFYVAANSQERLFVHAGAVGWKNQTLLIPGRSGSSPSQRHNG